MFSLIRQLRPNSTLCSIRRMGFASKEVTTETKKGDKKKEIQQMKDGVLTTRNHLVLKQSEDVEGYVMQVLKNYFRTTNKSNIKLESNLIDHGLDSLDQIEIAMVIEEELGYVISAETLPVLQKVKHIVNYIHHVE